MHVSSSPSPGSGRKLSFRNGIDQKQRTRERCGVVLVCNRFTHFQSVSFPVSRFRGFNPFETSSLHVQ